MVAGGVMSGRLAPIAVFLCLSSSLLWSLREAPAVNADLRLVGARGDWFVEHAPALFDHPRYAYEIGQSHLRRFFETGELEDVAQARSAFQLAVAAAPADAFAWSGLAWAEAGLGAVEAGRRALGASWRLAPYNRALALDRAGLVQSNALGADLSDAPGHRRDLDVLAQRGLEDAFEASSELGS